jgi:L-arabinonolactonase
MVVITTNMGGEMDADIFCVTSLPNDLGESLHWDSENGLLYWVDAWKALVCRYDPGTSELRQTDFSSALQGRPIGSIASYSSGGLIGGVQGGFFELDPNSGHAFLLASAETDRPVTNRLNDGKCDRAGRFWCASINTDRMTPTGALWRFDRENGARLMADGLVTGNGIAWSPDDRTMYLADSFAKQVWQYDFDLEAGEIFNKRLFVSTETLGVPDGATVDEDGCYWTALFRAGTVAQFDPDGKLMRKIALPVTYPTMCIFAGEALDTLYVTSATRCSRPGELVAEPQAGHLFAIRGLGTRGLPDAKFRG